MSSTLEPFAATRSHERAAYAIWLGQQHLRFDRGLTEVVYLPSGSPDDEIRLLEVNRGLFPTPDMPITPVEITPADAVPFRVVVADITPDEWTRLQLNEGSLPAGWCLGGEVVTRRLP